MVKLAQRRHRRRVGATMAHVEATQEAKAALFARPSTWEELPGMQDPASTRVDVRATRQCVAKVARSRKLTEARLVKLVARANRHT